jgi:hypothetical protein
VGRGWSGTAKYGRPMDSSEEGVISTSANLAAPIRITFDPEGNLYIADSQNHLIRKVAKWW